MTTETGLLSGILMISFKDLDPNEAIGLLMDYVIPLHNHENRTHTKIELEKGENAKLKTVIEQGRNKEEE